MASTPNLWRNDSAKYGESRRTGAWRILLHCTRWRCVPRRDVQAGLDRLLDAWGHPATLGDTHRCTGPSLRRHFFRVPCGQTICQTGGFQQGHESLEAGHPLPLGKPVRRRLRAVSSKDCGIPDKPETCQFPSQSRTGGLAQRGRAGAQLRAGDFVMATGAAPLG